MNDQPLEKHIKKILEAIGIHEEGECIQKTNVSNCIYSKTYKRHGTHIKACIVEFGGGRCRVDIDFVLPENAVLANTFMDHCAAIEKTPTNHSSEYCFGPTYRTGAEEHRSKQTFAYAPFDGTMFYIRSEHYLTATELDEAVNNAIGLASQFARHLGDLPTLRVWTKDDPEVIAKAKEITEKASLQETDCDREDRSHYIKDANSFIKGWFFPFNDRGRGTFDTVWPSSLDYAASAVGRKGTFEYAVASLVLVNPDFIRKARSACRIRKETIVRQY